MRSPAGTTPAAAARSSPESAEAAAESTATAATEPAAFPKFRKHVLAARFPGEAVGDPLLESVADFDPHLALVEREQNEQAVVLSLLADAAAVILEQLVGVLANVGERRDRLDRRDDDH